MVYNGHLIVRSKSTYRAARYGKYSRYFTLPNILLAVGFIVTIIIAQFINKAKFEKSKAATGQASITVLPATTTLSPSGSLQVWINSDKPVGFVQVALTFDPARITLTQNPVLTNTQLSRVAVLTPVATANATGKIVFAIGLDPAKRASPPAGAFQLATLNFSAISATANVQTTVGVTTAETSVVDTGAVLFITTTAGATLTLYPTTPTPTTAAANVPTPTGIMDSTPPVVVVTQPADNTVFTTSLWVRTTVTDPESPIASIKIFFDAKLYKTCSVATLCSTKINTRGMLVGSHSVVVTGTNQAGLTNSQAVIVNKQ